MGTGRIRVFFVEIGAHRVEHLGVNPGGCRVIEVDDAVRGGLRVRISEAGHCFVAMKAI